MKILLLGSNHNSTSLKYKQFNLPCSNLVTSINQDYTVGHTSRQEFSSDYELELVLAIADEVYWAFPEISEFTNNTEYYILLNWLKDYQLKYKNDSKYSIEDQAYFYEYLEFIPKSLMENYLVDFGTDNMHPGIESNKIIAKTIIDYINQIYEAV